MNMFDNKLSNYINYQMWHLQLSNTLFDLGHALNVFCNDSLYFDACGFKKKYIYKPIYMCVCVLSKL